MAPLLAEMWVDPNGKDNRGAARRTLRLQAQASSSRNAIAVLIHNLSRSGLMMETLAALDVGEEFLVELPEAGRTAARVVWTRDSFFGCEFLSPLSKGAVSAALLRTPVQPPDAVAHLQDVDHAASPGKASRATDMVATISLILLLFVAILFAAALLGLPFSAEQPLSFP